MLGLVLGPHRLGMALMLISSALCWACLLYWPTNYQQFAVLLPCCAFYWGWACHHVTGLGPKLGLVLRLLLGLGVPPCRKQAGSAFGQLVLRRLLSAPDHASGCLRLRPAAANRPLGPRWHPGHTSLAFHIQVLSYGGLVLATAIGVTLHPQRAEILESLSQVSWT